jgi:hypothetical protein
LLNHSYVKGESAPEKELLGTSREKIFKINISCDPAKAFSPLSFPLKISLRLREFRPPYSLAMLLISTVAYSFDTDSNPAFFAEYRSGSRVLMAKN